MSLVDRAKRPAIAGRLRSARRIFESYQISNGDLEFRGVFMDKLPIAEPDAKNRRTPQKRLWAPTYGDPTKQSAAACVAHENKIYSTHNLKREIKMVDTKEINETIRGALKGSEPYRLAALLLILGALCIIVPLVFAYFTDDTKVLEDPSYVIGAILGIGVIAILSSIVVFLFGIHLNNKNTKEPENKKKE